jgi:Flp pilus assembly protein TadD
MRVLLVCAVVGVTALQQFPPTSPPKPPVGAQRPQPAPQRQIPRVRSATGDALNRYVQGDYEAALVKLVLLGGFDSDEALVWIKAAGPEAVDRRRLIAATAALEYTAARPTLSPSLIEWAWDTLAQAPAPPRPEERLWLRASIALGEGRGAWLFLTGPAYEARVPARPAKTPDPTGGLSYLVRARARFPDDPRLKMADVVGLEVKASESSKAPAAGSSAAVDRLAADVVDLSAGDARDRVEALQQAVASLRELLSNETVGAEAHLRLGYVQLRLGHADAALQEFNRIGLSGGDPWVAFLGHLYSGSALARTNRVDDAVAAYRSALDILPHARSATMLLGALLLVNGRVADSETVTEAFALAPDIPDDPWHGYLLGDYRAYPDLIKRLREAIK